MELSEIKKRLDSFISTTENPYSKENIDHITGSAWIVDLSSSKALLTHHKKLNIWIQPGGHSEGEKDPYIIAKREGIEETNLTIEPISRDPFYFDIFTIPENKNTPKHKHYDITYIFKVTGTRKFKVSSESHDLKWISLSDIIEGDFQENIVNMAKLTLKRVINGR